MEVDFGSLPHHAMPPPPPYACLPVGWKTGQETGTGTSKKKNIHYSMEGQAGAGTFIPCLPATCPPPVHSSVIPHTSINDWKHLINQTVWKSSSQMEISVLLMPIM